MIKNDKFFSKDGFNINLICFYFFLALILYFKSKFFYQIIITLFAIFNIIFSNQGSILYLIHHSVSDENIKRLNEKFCIFYFYINSALIVVTMFHSDLFNSLFKNIESTLHLFPFGECIFVVILTLALVITVLVFTGICLVVSRSIRTYILKKIKN